MQASAPGLTPLESLWADARRLAGSLAELPAEAVAALKQSLRQGMDLDLARALELEDRLAARLAR